MAHLRLRHRHFGAERHQSVFRPSKNRSSRSRGTLKFSDSGQPAEAIVQSAGICYRLYTEASFLEKMPKTTIPEIQRVSLTFALLHLLAAGQDDVYKFKYMDNPSRESSKLRMIPRPLMFR